MSCKIVGFSPLVQKVYMREDDPKLAVVQVFKVRRNGGAFGNGANSAPVSAQRRKAAKSAKSKALRAKMQGFKGK